MSVFLKKDKNIATIELDLKDSKVNLLTADVIRELDRCLDEVAKDSSLKALVVKSNGH